MYQKQKKKSKTWLEKRSPHQNENSSKKRKTNETKKRLTKEASIKTNQYIKEKEESEGK
jgi:hypothetical protein